MELLLFTVKRRVKHQTRGRAVVLNISTPSGVMVLKYIAAVL